MYFSSDICGRQIPMICAGKTWSKPWSTHYQYTADYFDSDTGAHRDALDKMHSNLFGRGRDIPKGTSKCPLSNKIPSRLFFHPGRINHNISFKPSILALLSDFFFSPLQIFRVHYVAISHEYIIDSKFSGLSQIKHILSFDIRTKS